MPAAQSHRAQRNRLSLRPDQASLLRGTDPTRTETKYQTSPPPSAGPFRRFVRWPPTQKRDPIFLRPWIHASRHSMGRPNSRDVSEKRSVTKQLRGINPVSGRSGRLRRGLPGPRRPQPHWQLSYSPPTPPSSHGVASVSGDRW